VISITRRYGAADRSANRGCGRSASIRSGAADPIGIVKATASDLAAPFVVPEAASNRSVDLAMDRRLARVPGRANCVIGRMWSKGRLPRRSF
jgi:hypothetical protein